jgi:mannose-6-phosphate isomerase-like protein (cupin superfamily)
MVVAPTGRPQHHPMRSGGWRDFIEIWNARRFRCSSVEARSTSDSRSCRRGTPAHSRCPPQAGETHGHRTRRSTVVMIEGELVLQLDDSEVTLTAGDVVVQRTDHARENRSAGRPRRLLPHRVGWRAVRSYRGRWN